CRAQGEDDGLLDSTDVLQAGGDSLVCAAGGFAGLAGFGSGSGLLRRGRGLALDAETAAGRFAGTNAGSFAAGGWAGGLTAFGSRFAGFQASTHGLVRPVQPFGGLVL
ncbi:hypothetical protein DN549_33165, partial [Burkholderia multivorans]